MKQTFSACAWLTSCGFSLASVLPFCAAQARADSPTDFSTKLSIDFSANLSSGNPLIQESAPERRTFRAVKSFEEEEKRRKNKIEVTSVTSQEKSTIALGAAAGAGLLSTLCLLPTFALPESGTLVPFLLVPTLAGAGGAALGAGFLSDWDQIAVTSSAVGGALGGVVATAVGASVIGFNVGLSDESKLNDNSNGSQNNEALAARNQTLFTLTLVGATGIALISTAVGASIGASMFPTLE